MSPDCWEQHEKVNGEENDLLTRPFPEEEIKKVVMNMKRNTTLGPDHIPIEFYQACCHTRFSKENQVLAICMPGSSFIHIVTS
jgi:hypothetical protein